MKPVFISAWNAMDEYTKAKEGIYLTNDKDEFINKCTNFYNKFKKEYMDESTKVLDRHKISAIISIVAANGGYVKSEKKIDSNAFFLGRYNVPIVIALSFICQEMNKDLHNFNLIKAEQEISLYIPKPTSCVTEYIDSLARIIIYEEERETNDLLRVVELANVFFLIEECTLLRNGVNMEIWTKEKRKLHDI